MAMKGKVGVLAVLLVLIWGELVIAEDAALEKDCATLFPKVTDCLPFATGKNDVPTKECCTSVTTIKDTNPACLCYIIQQIHKGDANLKGLGLQEARLLQLPSVCKLTNVSVSDCPKLLNLPANSPDAAIFKNVSNASSSASPATPQSSGSTTTATEKSNSFKNAPVFVGHVALAFLAIFIFAFLSGIVFLS